MWLLCIQKPFVQYFPGQLPCDSGLTPFMPLLCSSYEELARVVPLKKMKICRFSRSSKTVIEIDRYRYRYIDIFWQIPILLQPAIVDNQKLKYVKCVKLLYTEPDHQGQNHLLGLALTIWDFRPLPSIFHLGVSISQDEYLMGSHLNKDLFFLSLKPEVHMLPFSASC